LACDGKAIRRRRKDSFTSSNLSGIRARLAALVRRVLGVYGSGMKSHCASVPVPAEQLKPVRHEKIERMSGEQLALLDRVLLQLEAEQAADRLSEAFDVDQAQGKLRRVAELVRQFRAEHRYA
jgi:hypothetical protein